MSDKKNTIREAMVSVALEEIDELTDKLEATAETINYALEIIPAHLEEAGNQVVDNIKHGVLVNIEIAQNTLAQTQKQISDNIEIQRRLNSQIKSIVEKLDDGNDNVKQILIPAISAFLGALIAVLASSFF